MTVMVTARCWAGAPCGTLGVAQPRWMAGPTVGVPFVIPPEAMATRVGLGQAQPSVFFGKTKAFLEIKLKTRQPAAGGDLFSAMEGCHACASMLCSPGLDMCSKGWLDR